MKLSEIPDDAMLDFPVACAALSCPKSTGYDLVNRDEFPVPVVRFGRRILVPRAPLLELLTTGQVAS